MPRMFSNPLCENITIPERWFFIFAGLTCDWSYVVYIILTHSCVCCNFVDYWEYQTIQWDHIESLKKQHRATASANTDDALYTGIRCKSRTLTEMSCWHTETVDGDVVCVRPFYMVRTQESRVKSMLVVDFCCNRYFNTNGYGNSTTQKWCWNKKR